MIKCHYDVFWVINEFIPHWNPKHQPSYSFQQSFKSPIMAPKKQCVHRHRYLWIHACLIYCLIFFFFPNPSSVMVIQVIKLINNNIIEANIVVNGTHLIHLQLVKQLLENLFYFHNLFFGCHFTYHGHCIKWPNSNYIEPFAYIMWIQCFLKAKKTHCVKSSFPTSLFLLVNVHTFL